MNKSPAQALASLFLLFAVNTVNFFDRQVFAAVTEPVRREWGLSDLQVGWLGTGFILLYAVIGVPLGRLADITRRTWLLASGLLFWSALTAVSGLSNGFWSFFCLRLGIGAGEASCAPSCASLIGDLFPREQRGRAFGIYMLGLPLGIALSFLIGGWLATQHGWRTAYFFSGIPGMLLAPLLVVLLPEPDRGGVESIPPVGTRRAVLPYAYILRTPTMVWIMVSGALHNFTLYALSAFLPSLLVRYHKTSLQGAGLICAVVIGIMGGAGMLVGGWAGDRLSRGPASRILMTAFAVLISAPAFVLALAQPPGRVIPFVLLVGLAWMLMYTYYSNIYATIQDLLEPTLRGVGMALYFLALYALGASMGPVVVGWLSDQQALHAATETGALAGGSAGVPELFRAIGLHRALYLVPVLEIALAAVLFAAAKTVRKDIPALQISARSE